MPDDPPHDAEHPPADHPPSAAAPASDGTANAQTSDSTAADISVEKSSADAAMDATGGVDAPATTHARDPAAAAKEATAHPAEAAAAAPNAASDGAPASAITAVSDADAATSAASDAAGPGVPALDIPVGGEPPATSRFERSPRSAKAVSDAIADAIAPPLADRARRRRSEGAIRHISKKHSPSASSTPADMVPITLRSIKATSSLLAPLNDAFDFSSSEIRSQAPALSTVSDFDWSGSLSSMRTHLTESVQVFYATTHILDGVRDALQNAASLLAEGEKLVAAVEPNLPSDGDYTASEAQHAMMRNELQRYAVSCKRLIGILRDSAELQMAMGNHQRSATRMSVASQRYIRYITDVASHIPPEVVQAASAARLAQVASRPRSSSENLSALLGDAADIPDTAEAKPTLLSVPQTGGSRRWSLSANLQKKAPTPTPGGRETPEPSVTKSLDDFRRWMARTFTGDERRSPSPGPDDRRRRLGKRSESEGNLVAAISRESTPPRRDVSRMDSVSDLPPASLDQVFSALLGRDVSPRAAKTSSSRTDDEADDEVASVFRPLGHRGSAIVAERSKDGAAASGDSMAAAVAAAMAASESDRYVTPPRASTLRSRPVVADGDDTTMMMPNGEAVVLSPLFQARQQELMMSGGRSSERSSKPLFGPNGLFGPMPPATPTPSAPAAAEAAAPASASATVAAAAPAAPAAAAESSPPRAVTGGERSSPSSPAMMRSRTMPRKFDMNAVNEFNADYANAHPATPPTSGATSAPGSANTSPSKTQTLLRRSTFAKAAMAMALRGKDHTRLVDELMQRYGASSESATSFAATLAEGNVLRLRENDADVMILELVDSQLVLSAAVLPVILERLADEYEQDENFVEVVLLTHSLFMPSSTALLRALVKRFNIVLPPDAAEAELATFAALRKDIQRKVLTVLVMWIKGHWYDFDSNATLLELLHDFLEDCTEAGIREADRVTRTLAQEANRLRLSRAAKADIGRAPVEYALVQATPFLEMEAREIAASISRQNMALFKAVTTNDVLAHSVNASSARMKLPVTMRETRAVEALLERSARLTRWAALEVCVLRSTKQRRLALTKMIKVARHCRENNDYFGTFAILDGLLMSAVKKQKKVWEGLPSKEQGTLETLTKLQDPSSNMKSYREALAKSRAPIVPFFPTFQREILVILERQNNNTDNMINVSKFRQLSNVINRTLKLAGDGSAYERVETVAAYLDDRIPSAPEEDVLAALAAGAED